MDAADTVCAQSYASLHRSGKGLMKRYIGKVTGLSRAQVTRLINQYAESGVVRARQGRGQRFIARYTPADIALLAEVDEAHETLSGPATQKILYRQHHEFADAGYERLSEISVAHIYNLRKRRSYREHRMVFTKPGPPRSRSASAVSPSPADGPAICVWTRYIRAIWTEPRVFIWASMQWTK